MSTTTHLFPSYDAAGLTDAGSDRFSGKNEKNYPCPECSHTRKPQNQKIKCLNVNFVKGQWRCNHCDWYGRLMTGEDAEAQKRRAQLVSEKQFTAPPALANKTGVSDRGLVWFEQERGIPRAIVERYDIQEKTIWMPDAFRKAQAAIAAEHPDWDAAKVEQAAHQDARVPTILFPYTRHGELVNFKYRARDAKDFRLHKNAELIFWGLDDIQGSREAFLVEGEMDKLAYATAGIFNVLSVPNGSVLGKEELLEWERTGKFDQNKPLRLEYLDNCWDDVQHIDTWYLSTDTDAPGMKLRAELLRRLGPGKCRFINHPEGCKDANDVLKNLGPEAVRQLKNDAQVPPVDGVVTVDDLWDELVDLVENGVEKGVPVGITEFDAHYSFKLPTLDCITGVPGDGKCLAKGTRVMLYSGRLVNVEDVKVGDQLMGPDSTPRNVLSLARGREQMYWVRQKTGEDYRVNESHMLTLCKRHTFTNTEVIDISVRDILDKPRSFLLSTWRGFKAPGVEYDTHEHLDGDPYQMGLSLGATAGTGPIRPAAPWHMADAYLYATRANRLSLLAGLLDAGSQYDGHVYEITQQNQALAQQIVQLSRSLGFYTSVVNQPATMDPKQASLWCIQISGGGVNVIPCRVSSPALRTRASLVTRITLEKDIVDDYYGFTIDGDRRFLLGDLTVTHNTTVVVWMIVLTALQLGWRWALYSSEQGRLAKLLAQVYRVLVGKPYIKGSRDPLRKADLEQWKSFVREHFVLIDYEQVRTPAALMEKTAELVGRYGINARFIDPWGSMAHIYKPEDQGREDLYITRVLTEMREQNAKFTMATFINLHPNSGGIKRQADGSYPVVSAREVSGGPAFWNRTDNFWTVHRRRCGLEDYTSDVYFWKIKHQDEIGVPTAPGEPVVIEFDPRTARFHGFVSRSAPECFRSSVPQRASIVPAEKAAPTGPVESGPVYQPVGLPESSEFGMDAAPAAKAKKAESTPDGIQELLPW